MPCLSFKREIEIKTKLCYSHQFIEIINNLKKNESNFFPKVDSSMHNMQHKKIDPCTEIF